jgi:hypothetical protein
LNLPRRFEDDVRTPVELVISDPEMRQLLVEVATASHNQEIVEFLIALCDMHHHRAEAADKVGCTARVVGSIAILQDTVSFTAFGFWLS